MDTNLPGQPMSAQTVQINVEPMVQTQEVIYEGPAQNGSVNWKKRINVDAVHKYWMDVVGKERLEEDQTVRLTANIPYKDQKGVVIRTQLTLHEQVRDAEEMIQLIEVRYNGCRDNEFKKEVGFSMSPSTFKYSPPTLEADGKIKNHPPGKSTFIGTQMMVLDLDSHPSEKSSERFHFNSFNESSRRIIAMQTLNKLNQTFKDVGADIVLQLKNVYCTGGGLQFIIQFDKVLTMLDAEKTFTYIKKALTQASNRFVVHGFDALNNVHNCWFEFDISSGDITHTQRVGGLLNPKTAYCGSFSEELKDFYDEDKNDQAIVEYKALADQCSLDSKMIQTIRQDVTTADIMFKDFYKLSKEVLDVASLLNKAVFNMKGVEVIKTGSAELFNAPMDLEIIKKIQPTSLQVEFMAKLCPVGATEQSSSYIKYLCPFHEETSPSFAIYKNENGLAAIARDFHNEVTYNIITLLMAEKKQTGHPGMTRTEAIQTLAIEFGFELGKGERKSFDNVIVEGAVEEKIKEINMKDFIYYRLANKSRACIIREFENGEAYTFDGTRMMTDHVLINQLGQIHADMELRSLFHDRFCEKILVNAFEEFSPGRDYTYKRNFIQYVNLWIPGKDYKKIHKLAEQIEPLDIVSALGMIKARLPVMWYYLNQITQKGNLEYFTNWLAAVASFEVMSSIPVVTSVQGTGKNLFIDEVLSFYLNQEYVNVVNSDKIGNNFNSFLETSSLVVLDEGEFSNTKDLNNLKLITGNKFIQVEKKGIDSMKVARNFNLIMFTNGDTPLHHPSNDRRVSYFRLDVAMEQSVQELGFEFIDDMIVALKEEVTEFWAILVKTKTRKEWVNMNIKDNQFNKQILLMHPFGKLVIKLVEDDWEYIRLQMNEKVEDHNVITTNLEMLATIKKTFDATGSIDLTLINKYISSLNYKSWTGVQQFIEINNLGESGITRLTSDTSVKIIIDKAKVKRLIEMNNNLGNLYDCYKSENIEKTLRRNIHTIEDVLLEKEKAAHEQINTDPTGLVPKPNLDPLGIVRPIDPSLVIQ